MGVVCTGVLRVLLNEQFDIGNVPLNNNYIDLNCYKIVLFGRNFLFWITLQQTYNAGVHTTPTHA